MINWIAENSFLSLKQKQYLKYLNEIYNFQLFIDYDNNLLNQYKNENNNDDSFLYTYHEDNQLIIKRNNIKSLDDLYNILILEERLTEAQVFIIIIIFVI